MFVNRGRRTTVPDTVLFSTLSVQGPEVGECGASPLSTGVSSSVGSPPVATLCHLRPSGRDSSDAQGRDVAPKLLTAPGSPAREKAPSKEGSGAVMSRGT